MTAAATHRASALVRPLAMLSPSSPSSPSAPPPPPLRRHLLPLFFALLLAFSCVLFLPISSPLVPSPARRLRHHLHLPTSVPPFPLAPGPPPVPDRPRGIAEVLRGAAMEDGTVILTTLNAAWAGEGSVVDLFLESFRIGDHTRALLDHLVVVALDEGALARCVQVHEHCLALQTEGVDFSGEKRFMSQGYLRMMWRRIDFLREVLESGFHFIFTDTDVLWFRNPLPYFDADADFQIACDHFMGIYDDLHNKPNGGFSYVRSNNRTIQFYKFWYSSRLTYPGYHDQDVLNFIKGDRFLIGIGLQIRFLDTARFGGLCEPSKDFNKVCTMHVNCCIGLQRKLHDLRVMLEDWRRFMSLPPSIKGSGLVSWSVPQKCSLAPLDSSIA